MFDILLGLLRFRKSMKQARLVKAVVSEEVLRNAMSYAYEIGAGSNLFEKVDTSFENPFLNPNWRNYIIPGSEA